MKFHTKRFEKEVGKALSSKKIREEAYKTADQKVRQAHKKMMNDFDSHPVTREIESGPTAENISGTLRGYGNLFTFIGFSKSSDPISPIRNYLSKTGRVYRQPKIIKRRNETEMVFKIESPKFESIEALAPSPWEGKSWARSMERGLSGFGYYMYSLHKKFTKSRSGKAAQTSKKLRSMAFRPVKYISSILNKFYKDTK